MSQSTLQTESSGGLPLATRLASWLQALDQILRGETTCPSALREHSLRIPIAGLSVLILGLALFYGFCMGMYPGFRVDDPSYLRWLSCTLKIPALFLLTLAVTFPSLYVVNALVGSRLQLLAVLRLLVAALGVNLSVLASAGPIVAFFSFSTTNCPFMVLLNVLVFAIAGLLGMVFLLQTLHRLSAIPKAAASRSPHSGPLPESEGRAPCTHGRRAAISNGAIEPGETRPADPSSAVSLSWEHDRWLSDPKGPQPAVSPDKAISGECEDDPCALDSLEGHVLGRHVKKVFCCWTLIFSVVGAQMAWVLRPYFGEPGEAFVWFGPRTSNFFEGVWMALHQLLS